MNGLAFVPLETIGFLMLSERIEVKWFSGDFKWSRK